MYQLEGKKRFMKRAREDDQDRVRVLNDSKKSIAVREVVEAILDYVCTNR